MKKISRRSFLRVSPEAPALSLRLPPRPAPRAIDGTSRRAFLQSTAGAAAGAAVILATPKVASVALDRGGSHEHAAEGHRREAFGTGTARARDGIHAQRRAQRGDSHGRQAGDHLQRPGARQAAARGSPLSHRRRKRGRHMSSHREAPEISKDPVADNTDTYAFVSPDNPETRHDHHKLPSRGGAGGRSDVLRVRQRRALQDPHRQRRRRVGRTSPTSSASNRRSPIPNTFLYNTGPIGSLTDPNWSQRQSYTVTRVDHSDRRTSRRVTARSRSARRGTGVSSLQHRAALDAQLREARAGSGALAARRPDGLRRAAKRPVLRRHRVDLRPRATCARSRTCT